MRRLVIGAALAVTLGTAAAGCGSSGDKPRTTPQAAWAAKVCSSIGLNEAVRLPAVTEDAKAYKANIAAFLAQLARRMDTMEAGLKKAGVPPVSDGQATYDAALTKLEGAKTVLNQVRTKLNTTKVTDTKSLRSALAGLSQQVLASVSYTGPRDDLRRNPALTTAFDTVPACQVKKS
ncbi:hypothetical protein [Actinomadura rayongensis]|uniref:Small secreted protein n=1 Tax=Actinomadura rayongensis TaxID=1429076 RepID=A0A6I4WDB9_9ACTN|nr:hypothetical protein [Actinomadura rayongensis]MXQ66810.1 hypothetical protein [Actinomadura rayongensis]